MENKDIQNKYESLNERTVERYTKRFEQHGYSAQTLGWNKGKQFERFHQLTSDWDLTASSILDVGCGFCDFIEYMQKSQILDCAYYGIDVTPALLDEAKTKHSADNNKFICMDFLAFEKPNFVDYCFASGVFNHKNDEFDPYDYVWHGMKKIFSFGRKAIAFDLLSDKVDYRLEHTNHYNPGKILEMAYGLSRNIVLKNNYFPFEYAVIINKNDDFNKETTIFDMAVHSLAGKW